MMMGVKLFTKGSRITQPNYGAGTVESSDERYTVIDFDNHGRRTFVSSLVALDKSDKPAPDKPVTARRKAPAKASTKPAK